MPHVHAMQVRKIVVQTTDTVRYTHLLHLAVSSGYPALLVGPTGTGKSAYTLKYLKSLPTDTFAPAIVVGLSARTSANTTQVRNPNALRCFDDTSNVKRRKESCFWFWFGSISDV